MFDRVKYKRFARIQLKSRWTAPVLSTLISLIIIQPLIYCISFGIYQDKDVTLALISYLISSWIFEMAFAHFFIIMSRSPSPVNVNDFIEGIGLWKRGILFGFWRDLWVFLWTLLFIIPGIVKRYAYSQVIFLAAEFPSLTAKKAMQISKIMTANHKADLFVLDLSFLGWWILSSLTRNVGDLWLTPYIKMTKINAYHDLLQSAIEEKMITLEDLGITEKSEENENE